MPLPTPDARRMRLSRRLLPSSAMCSSAVTRATIAISPKPPSMPSWEKRMGEKRLFGWVQRPHVQGREMTVTNRAEEVRDDC